MKNSTIKFLIAIKNNSISRKEQLILEYTTASLQIVLHLYSEGLIQSYKILNNKCICIILRYYHNKPVFRNLKIWSTPSKSRYLTATDVIHLSNQRVVYFISTDKGILTQEVCKKLKIGGIILFCV